MHYATFHSGTLFDHCIFFSVFGYFSKQFPAFLGEGDFSSPEDNGYFYLVFFPYKFFNTANFNFQIMGLCLGADFYFLNLKSGLFFLGLLQFFCLLVFKAAVIHYFADRRVCIWRNFNKIQACFFGGRKGFLNGDDPELIAFRVNYPSFTGPDVPVDSGLIAALSLSSYSCTS
jgi:hypothetical protein